MGSKAIPQFNSEEEESEFWEHANLTDYFDKDDFIDFHKSKLYKIMKMDKLQCSLDHDQLTKFQGMQGLYLDERYQTSLKDGSQPLITLRTIYREEIHYCPNCGERLVRTFNLPKKSDGQTEQS